MKFSTIFFVALLPATMATGGGDIGECAPIDCTRDSDCVPGLLCADAHKAELKEVGCDERKAYCDSSIGRSNWELCYDPDKVPDKCDDEPDDPDELLGLCEVDCDVEGDCEPDLLCADKHQAELEANGWDPRKANCGPVGLVTDEVCFDPTLLFCPAGTDFICGVTPPTYCDEANAPGSCLCETDVHGDHFCLEQGSCGLPEKVYCDKNSDCAEGMACVVSCCGSKCANPCNSDRRLESTEHHGLRSRALGCTMEESGCVQ